MELRNDEDSGFWDENGGVRDFFENGGKKLRKGKNALQRAKRAGRGLKNGGRLAARGIRAANRAEKYLRIGKENRAALSYLSPEQRRQWNSYSRRQQAKILADVQRKVDRRMAPVRESAVQTPPMRMRKPVDAAYRRAERERPGRRAVYRPPEAQKRQFAVKKAPGITKAEVREGAWLARKTAETRSKSTGGFIPWANRRGAAFAHQMRLRARQERVRQSGTQYGTQYGARRNPMRQRDANPSALRASRRGSPVIRRAQIRAWAAAQRREALAEKRQGFAVKKAPKITKAEVRERAWLARKTAETRSKSTGGFIPWANRRGAAFAHQMRLKARQERARRSGTQYGTKQNLARQSRAVFGTQDGTLHGTKRDLDARYRARQFSRRKNAQRFAGRQPGNLQNETLGRVYINPEIKKETYRKILIRRTQTSLFSDRGKPRQRGSIRPPRLAVDARKRQCLAQKGNALGSLRRADSKRAADRLRGRQGTGYGADIRRTNKGFVLKDELDQLSSGTNGHRYVVRSTRRPKKKVYEMEDTFYTASPSKAERKIRRIEKRQKKDAKKLSKKQEGLFRKEFRSVMDRDRRKRQAIRNFQRSTQMAGEPEGREVEDAAHVLQIGTRPLRTVISEQLKKLAQTVFKLVAQAVAPLIPFFLMAAGLLIGLIAVLMVINGIFSSIITNEESQTAGNISYASGAGTEIEAYAEEWIGVIRYVWGAGRASDTDWQDYADCSSFVHGVFLHFGYEIGGTTYTMENAGTVITGGLTNAVPGDIILFYSGSIGTGLSSHVGIYAGDGMMIHCSGNQTNTMSNPGRGVIKSAVAGDSRPYEIRRIATGSGTGGGYDRTEYTQGELELIWAIVRQEAGTSYESNLAVISTALNRVHSAAWASYGSNVLQQLTAPSQFCYSLDSYWQKYLYGNVPEATKQAVRDCLENGITNHSYTSFRSGYVTGSVRIPEESGNYYFN